MQKEGIQAVIMNKYRVAMGLAMLDGLFMLSAHSCFTHRYNMIGIGNERMRLKIR